MLESKAVRPNENSWVIWGALISLAVFVTCLLLVFLTSDWQLGASLPCGWIALFALTESVWRLTRVREGLRRNAARVTIRVALVASVFGYAFLNMICFGNLREYAIQSISSSNLRGISIGLRMYCEKEGVPPSSWDDLIRSGISSPGQFIRPLDPDTYESKEGKVVGTSYVFRGAIVSCPSSGGEIVAYERLAWTPRDVRLLQRYWRQGITADGELRFLEDAEAEKLR